jgi:hypothetical protein
MYAPGLAHYLFNVVRGEAAPRPALRANRPLNSCGAGEYETALAVAAGRATSTG